MKEEMLTVFEPSLIHEQYVGEETKRVFSTEKDYDKLLQEKSNDIIWKGGYRDENDIEVKFFDYKLGRKNIYIFYFMKLGSIVSIYPFRSKRLKSILNYKLKKLTKILRLMVPILRDYFQHNL